MIASDDPEGERPRLWDFSLTGEKTEVTETSGTQFSVFSVSPVNDAYFGGEKIVFVYLPIAGRSGTIQCSSPEKELTGRAI